MDYRLSWDIQGHANNIRGVVDRIAMNLKGKMKAGSALVEMRGQWGRTRWRRKLVKCVTTGDDS